MMIKNQIIKVIGFGFTFIFFALVGCEVWASEASQVLDDDSVELVVYSTTGYPGHFVEVSVWMKNPVPIASFKIQFTLDWPELINFHTDSIGVEWVAIPLDTCPAFEETCLVDTCWWEPDNICMDTLYFPVRYCYLDTVGSLISDFEMISCHGDVGDTNLPDCKWLTVVGMAYTDSSIDPDPNFRLLFKFGVDLFCMCDAETARNTLFLVSPGFSGFGDPQGFSVPFKYYMGDVSAWWSVPGDASNDSAVNVGDVIELVNYVLLHGSEPCIWEAADPDSSCVVNIGDIIYMVTYLYQKGPSPKPGCSCPYPPKERIKRTDEEFELLENPNLKPLFERR
jgi:hypothetical protein